MKTSSSASGAAQILAPPHRRRAPPHFPTAFAALAVASHPTEAIGDALVDAYNALHDEELSLFPDAQLDPRPAEEVGRQVGADRQRGR
jgi:hypothetical protein